MYRRKRRYRRSTKEKAKRIWIAFASMILITGMTGIFTFMAVVVLAAPKELGAQNILQWMDETGDVSGNEFTEGGADVSGNGLMAGMMDASGNGLRTGTMDVSGNGIFAEAAKEPYIPLIVVDAGHGGEDVGCVEGGVAEKDVNLQIALLVKSALEEKGYRVMMPRATDEYLEKEERVELANSYQADAYVSIHQNTYEGTDKSISGIETWYDGSDDTRDSSRLARLIHKAAIASTEAVERELLECADFCVTGKTLMPACLIETGFLSNPQERALLSTTEYQEKIARGICNGIDLYFNPKTMYLTFDDGPSAECTDKVLDVLKEKDIKATFFLIGEYVEKYPEVARRIVAEGHTIGIHCYQHDYEVLYASKENFLADFQKAYDVIYQVTGVETKLFRFPGGSVNAYNKDVREEIIEEMTNRGYVYFDWNASLEDAAGENEPSQLIENAVSTTLGRKRIVMLAHDRVSNTALCLNELLEQFPEYKMEILTADTEPIQF